MITPLKEKLFVKDYQHPYYTVKDKTFYSKSLAIKNCKDIGSKIYSLLNIKIIKTSSIEIAEFTKILENVYRSVNIGLVKEVKMLCSKM